MFHNEGRLRPEDPFNQSVDTDLTPADDWKDPELSNPIGLGHLVPTHGAPLGSTRHFYPNDTRYSNLPPFGSTWQCMPQWYLP